MARIGLEGRVARGGGVLLVGPPRCTSATDIAWGNQHAQRGRGLPLSIVPVTSQVDCLARVPSIPAVVAEADGGVSLPTHAFRNVVFGRRALRASLPARVAGHCPDYHPVRLRARSSCGAAHSVVQFQVR